MALVTNMEKIAAIKKKMVENQAKKGGSGFNDDRLIQWEAGKTYKFRLLFYKNDNTEFDSPFITKWLHGARNADGKYKMITCPTTFYEKSGFDKCPVCKINNKLYHSKVESDYELYKKFRRKFNGYALVYVVQDKQNPDNEGHAKIIRFGIDIWRALKSKLGIEVSEDTDPDDIYDFGEVFSLDEGYDLVVRVSKKGDWLDYEVDFSKKKTALKFDADALEAELVELKFGEDIREESEERLQEFYDTCVLEDVSAEDENEVKDAAETAASEATSESASETGSVDDDISQMLAEVNAGSSKKETKKETSVEDAAADVDDLLSQIESEVKGK